MLTQHVATLYPDSMLAESVLRAGLSPYSIARTIWKQKWFFLIVFGVLAAIGITIVHQLPPVYEGQAVVLVDSQKIPDKYVTSTVSSGLQDRLAGLTQQILSSSRLMKIVDDFGLYREDRRTKSQEEVADAFRSHIHIMLIRGVTTNADKDKPQRANPMDRRPPDAFRISYESANANSAALVANRLASLFVEENLRERETHAAGTSDFIDQQLVEAKKRLDEQEQRIGVFKAQHSGELPEQENSVLATLSRLQLQYQAAQDALNRAQQDKLMQENAVDASQNTLAALTRAANSATAAATTAKQNKPTPQGAGTENAPPSRSAVIQAQLDAARLRYSPEHPEVKRLQRELAQVQALERQEQQSAAAAAPFAAPTPAAPDATVTSSPTMFDDILKERNRLSTLKARLEAANREITNRTQEMQKVSADIARYQRQIDHMPLREQEMAGLMRDYDISKANYRSLLDKKFAADMSADMEHRQQAERFTILELAQTPETPTSPNRPVLDAASVVIALGIAIALLFVREFRRNVILGEWELPPNVPILGRVPHISIPAPVDTGRSAG